MKTNKVPESAKLLSGVISVLRTLGLDDIDITSKTKIKEDLGFDSLKQVELIVEIENYFNIVLSEEDLDPFRLITIGDLCSLVERYKR